MSEAVLTARGLDKSYPSAAGPLDVLRGLDLEIEGGQAIAVVGDSGVGKSTLLHVLGGLDRPQRGTLLYRGQSVYGRSTGDIAEYRNRAIGFVFQFHHLLPELTALENVALPFRIGRRDGFVREAHEILERIGLGHRLHHRPGKLSGGEQQRVAIARAVAPGPALILADEPTGNLDPATGAAVFALLRQLQSERGFALVVATHSGRLARGCDRILRLEDGRLRRLDADEAGAYFDGGGPEAGAR